MKAMVRRSSYSAFVVFPMMAGLIAVADPSISIILTVGLPVFHFFDYVRGLCHVADSTLQICRLLMLWKEAIFS